MSTSRRQFIQTSAAALALGASLPSARAQDDKILIGYWPIASGLPLYTALERGFFKEAGLNVEGVKFASAQQVAEAMIAGRIHGSANGTASGPGIQNVTLAKIILEKNGIADAKVVELPIGQHVPALAADQLDAVYTLEPTGTAGRLKGLTRVLENGVISKYVLGAADAPWFGGSASVTTTFLKERPADAKKYIAAYARAVDFVRKNPTEVRKHIDGFTAIDPSLVQEVPLSGFTLYNEFTASDLGYFQKFFDIFTERKIFSRAVPVKPLIYVG